jgi:hypothetical protein
MMTMEGERKRMTRTWIRLLSLKKGRGQRSLWGEIPQRQG